MAKKDLKVLITASLNEALSAKEIQAKLDKIAPELKLDIGLDLSKIQAMNDSMNKLLNTMNKVQDASAKVKPFNKTNINTKDMSDNSNGKSDASLYKNLQARANEIQKATGELAKITMKTSDKLNEIQQASISYVDGKGRQVVETFKFIEKEATQIEGVGKTVDGSWEMMGRTISDDIKKRTELTDKLIAKQKELREEIKRMGNNVFLSQDDRKNLIKQVGRSSDLNELKEIQKTITDAKKAQDEMTEAVAKTIANREKESRVLMGNQAKAVQNNTEKDMKAKIQQKAKAEEEYQKKSKDYIDWWTKTIVDLDQKESRQQLKKLQNIKAEREEIRKKLDLLKAEGVLNEKQHKDLLKGSFDAKGQKMNAGLIDVKDEQSLKQYQKTMDATVSALQRGKNASNELRNAKIQLHAEMKKLQSQGRLTNEELKSFGKQLGLQNSMGDLSKLREEVKKTASLTEQEFKAMQDKILKQGEKIKGSHSKMFGKDFLGNVKPLQKVFDEIEKETLALTRATPNLSAKYAELDKRIKDVVVSAKAQAGAMEKSGMSIREMMSTAMVKFPVWMASATLFYAPFRALESALTQILEVDKQMTEFQRVSDGMATNQEILEQTFQIADKLGNKLTEVNEAMIGFARQGFEGDGLAQMAEVATLMSNVSDLSIGDAQSSITSAMKAFNIEAKDSIQIADQLNEVDNKFAIRKNCSRL